MKAFHVKPLLLCQLVILATIRTTTAKNPEQHAASSTNYLSTRTNRSIAAQNTSEGPIFASGGGAGAASASSFGVSATNSTGLGNGTEDKGAGGDTVNLNPSENSEPNEDGKNKDTNGRPVQHPEITLGDVDHKHAEDGQSTQNARVVTGAVVGGVSAVVIFIVGAVITCAVIGHRRSNTRLPGLPAERKPEGRKTRFWSQPDPNAKLGRSNMRGSRRKSRFRRQQEAAPDVQVQAAIGKNLASPKQVQFACGETHKTLSTLESEHCCNKEANVLEQVLSGLSIQPHPKEEQQYIRRTKKQQRLADKKGVKENQEFTSLPIDHGDSGKATTTTTTSS